ncbi:UNVERIFIED_CONTAM: hypothetical protein Slati_1102500 [Sesamum latifolium]|uniref:Retrotransposon gag domain-containing protein n=1 Tax=Sesamum latifolium TaxID=2727402 RepID=A0AAW2XDD0_9LAMI
MEQRWKQLSGLEEAVIISLGVKMELDFIDGKSIRAKDGSEDLELEARFGESNGLMIYQIQHEIASVSQGNMTVTEYYTKIKKLWDELICLVPNRQCTYECSCGASKDVDNLGAQNQLMQFLMGLNATFDLSHNQILMMDMLPTVTKAYSMILRVEKQMQVNMLLSDVSDNSVFQVKDWYKSLNEQKKKKSGKGKASAGAVEDKSNSSLEKSDVADFLKSELRKLMKEEAVSLDPLQINFVHMEDFAGKVSCPSSIKSTSWIIDTGAIKHICSDIKRFVSYSEPIYQAFINLSDGSKQPDQRTKKVLALGKLLGRLYMFDSSSFLPTQTLVRLSLIKELPNASFLAIRWRWLIHDTS